MKILNKEWKPVEDRFEKKFALWLGKLLLYGNRLVLINSVLTSLPMFPLSFFEILKGVWKRLDFYMSRFFWQRDRLKRSTNLLDGTLFVDQKYLGIEVLDSKNKCLVSKWLFKLLYEEEVGKNFL
jgi:hypothetical protein